MATKQIKDYSAKTALDSTDQFLIQESGDTTKKTTTAELGILDGWIPVAETWTYASADDPTYTFTITGNYTTRYSVGMKIKLTQTTVKYFIITAISYSAPSTTVTVYGGTDYDLADAAITLPYYSMVDSPYGFPKDPDKWAVSYSSTSYRYKTSPTASTYYGGANAWTSGTNVSFSCPIGIWNIELEVGVQGTKSTAYVGAQLHMSESDNGAGFITPSFAAYQNIGTPYTKKYRYSAAAKITHYLLMYTGTSSVDEIRLISYNVKYRCAYL
jgi:hypothetical protein